LVLGAKVGSSTPRGFGGGPGVTDTEPHPPELLGRAVAAVPIAEDEEDRRKVRELLDMSGRKVHWRSSSFSRCCVLSSESLGTLPCFCNRAVRAAMSAGPRPPVLLALGPPEMLPLRRDAREPTAGWKEHSEISWASRCLRSSWLRRERRSSQTSPR